MKKTIANHDATYKIISFSLLLISTSIIVLALKNMQSLFIPLMFAVFFTFLFDPFHRFLTSKKVPNSLAVLIVLVAVFSVMYLIGYLIFLGAQSFVSEFPKYEEIFSSRFNNTIETLKIYMPDLKMDLKDYLFKIDWASMWDRLSISKIIKATMGTFVDFLVKLLLSLVFMLFLMASKDRLIEALELSQKKKYGESNLTRSLLEIENSIGKYFAVKSLISLGTALVSMLFMGFFGIDFILFSGLLLFFLNFIPNFGSITASAFPVLIAFLEYGISWEPFAIAIALTVTQFAFGNLIEPKYIGNTLNISPLFILLSLIFWAWVWGAVGMVLAIPLTSCINLIIKEIPSMRTISILLSGDVDE